MGIRMTEDDPTFDLTKKKKKKKKTAFDPEADGEKQEEAGTEGAEEEVSPVKKEKKKVIFDEESKDDVDIDDIDLESFGSKKKKKKKRGGEGLDNLDDLNEALPDEEEAAKDDDDDMDFNDDSFADKKKKKKKKKVDVDDLDDGDADKENEGEGDSADPWTGSDRDYLYDELLQRVFGIMRDKNPDMVAGEKKKFVMRPPQVVRVGSKKTAFANFSEIAKMLHRQPKHLLAFLFAELGTSGAIDGSNQLIMKGRFQQAHRECVETVHQGVCNLSHLQIAGHDPKQGDAFILPAVHDLPLLLQRADHQDRFPGCHRQEKVTPSENHLDRHLDCLDHHPGHPGSALLPPPSLYLTSLVCGISLRTTPCWQIIQTSLVLAKSVIF